MRIEERRSPLRVALGLAGASVLGAILIAPLARPRPSAKLGPQASASALAVNERLSVREHELRAEALSAATSLASALTELARVKTLHERDAQREPTPPLASSFPSASACLASYLPKLEPADQALGFICEKTDLWAIERKLSTTLLGKRGQGADLWRRRGPRSLGALAAMRNGCCVDAEPLTAVVPGLWCGILRDKLRAVTAVPERSVVRELEHTVGCLAERGVRLPSHWATVPAGRSQRAFDEFLRIARERAAAADRSTNGSLVGTIASSGSGP